MSMLRKLLPATVVALSLAVMPSHVAAMEKPAAPPAQSAALEWLSGVFEEVVTWFTVAAPSSSSGPVTIQGSCAVDPFGCPGHG